jgi:hypothetical protein
MSKTKNVHNIEIIEVYTIEGKEGFGPIQDHIVVIPDPSVKNGTKRTYANKIFVSPMNFEDMKLGIDPEGVIHMIGLLDETNI